MKRLYCLFIIILCLAISIPSYAQFTINGKHIIYDKQNDTYMACIPEDAFGKDYEAIILLDIASDWSDLSIDGTQIAYSYTFKQVEGNKLYSIHARKGNKEINTKITFTFLPLLVLQGSFGYDYAQGSMSLYSSDATEPTISLIKPNGEEVPPILRISTRETTR